jgi:hypothetical protein
MTQSFYRHRGFEITVCVQVMSDPAGVPQSGARGTYQCRVQIGNSARSSPIAALTLRGIGRSPFLDQQDAVVAGCLAAERLIEQMLAIDEPDSAEANGEHRVHIQPAPLVSQHHA